MLAFWKTTLHIYFYFFYLFLTRFVLKLTLASLALPLRKLITREVTKSSSNHKARDREGQDSNLELLSTWPVLFPLYHATHGFDLEVISLKPFMSTHEETEAQIATVS